MFGIDDVLIGAAAKYLIPLAADGISSLFSDDGDKKTAASVTKSVLSTAVQVAGDVTGVAVTDPATARQAADVIKGDPVKMAEYQRLLNERTTIAASAEATRLHAENERLAGLLADRANARSFGARTGDKTQRELAFIILGAFVAAVVALMWGALTGAPGLKDPTISAMVGGVIGYLSAKAETVVGYYFGGSLPAAAQPPLESNIAPLFKRAA